MPVGLTNFVSGQLIAEAREVVVKGRLDDVVDVGDLPLQVGVGALSDVALKRNVVHLAK